MSRIVTSTCRIAVSGYFDPLHAGHLEYFERAKNCWTRFTSCANCQRAELIVILNTDSQATLKKGRAFMPQQERFLILNALKVVDYVIFSVDNDLSVCKTLEMLNPNIFAKGGDRFADEVPERAVCDRLGIRLVDGLGEKIQSSSKLISNSQQQQKENICLPNEPSIELK